MGQLETSEKPYTDSEIAQLVQSDLREGVRFVDTKLVDERTTAMGYYKGDYPKRVNTGSSGYRSLDVYDQVESARSLLLETFAGSELPIEVTPTKDRIKGAVSAALATQYVNNCIFEKNNGDEILDQVIFDALMSRVGIVRIYWEKYTEREEQVMENVPIEAVDMLADRDEVSEVEITLEAEESTHGTAKVVLERPAGRLTIEQVRPEDFLVNTSAQNDTERTIGQRISKRLSEWIEDGYDKEDLYGAMSETDKETFEQEQFARNDAGGVTDHGNNRPDDPWVTLVDAYATLDMDRNGKPALWRVLLSGNIVLEKDMVESHPFVIYRPIFVPHIFHGASFVKTVIPTANAKTALTRSVIDHAMRTNNPRWTILNGTVKSSRELLENKPGGVVNVDKPDGIRPLDQPSLNPFVFQTIQLLDTDLSDTTGISRLTQGVDKDVVSNQNSRGMVKDLNEMSQQRFRIMARRFATQFLAILAKKVYEIATANDKEVQECVVDGKPMQFKPADWPKSSAIKIDLELSPETKAARVQEIGETVAALNADPDLSKAFSYGYKRKMIVKAMKLRGFQDAEMALEPEIPEPSEMQKRMQEAEVRAKEIENEVRTHQEQISERKVAIEEMKVMAELDIDTRKFYLEQMKAQTETAIEERKQASKEANDLFEKQITLEQMSQPESAENVKSIVSVGRT